MSGYPQPEQYLNLKLHSSDILFNTPGTPVQVHHYPDLNPLNNHNRIIIEHVNDNEIHELTSIGTQDTVPIVNGYSPEQNLGEGGWGQR